MSTEDQRSFDELRFDIAMTPTRAKAATLKPLTDGQRADLLGLINSVERRLADIRRAGQSELPANTVGEEWTMRQGRKATRSYDTMRLLVDLGGGDNPVETLHDLLYSGVLTVTWHYSKLKQEAAARGTTLVTAQREVGLDDPTGAHIGEVWKDDYPRWEAVTGDDKDQG